MPDLLDDITARDADLLRGWAAAFAQVVPQLDGQPPERRLPDQLDLARGFARLAELGTAAAEDFLAGLLNRLRLGMGGDALRRRLAAGGELCRLSRRTVETCRDLWRLAGAAGAPADEVRAAEDALAAVERRLVAVEAQVAALTKRSPRPTPEMIAELFQRAEASGPVGPGLPLEHALAAVRKSG